MGFSRKASSSSGIVRGSVEAPFSFVTGRAIDGSIMSVEVSESVERSMALVCDTTSFVWVGLGAVFGKTVVVRGWAEE